MPITTKITHELYHTYIQQVSIKLKTTEITSLLYIVLNQKIDLKAITSVYQNKKIDPITEEPVFYSHNLLLK